MAHAYSTLIAEDGKAGLFWLLLGFLVAFATVRLIVRGIRRGARWAGDVTVGDVHVHHVVPGVVLMVVSGILGFATTPPTPWLEMLSAAFGVGAALTMDEFALLLRMDDVYWAKEGRRSLDAVVLVTTLLLLLLLGVVPLRSDGIDSGAAVGGRVAGTITIAVNLALTTITIGKGKVLTALLGVFLPPLSLVGAVRLARPSSPWARWRYGRDPGRLALSETRLTAVERRRDRIYDLIGGTPDR